MNKQQPINPAEYKHFPCPACGQLQVDVVTRGVFHHHRFAGARQPWLDVRTFFVCVGCGHARNDQGYLVDEKGNVVQPKPKIETEN